MRRVFPIAVAFVLAAIWLNQGTTLARTEALAAEIAADPGGHALDRARYPLLFLYRQAWDQEIYFAVARATRGLAYDKASLVERGATSLADAPEADGKWHRPYVEVPLEYPAAMLPFMLAPSFVASTLSGYGHAFGVLMAACLVLAAWLALRGARVADGRDQATRWWAFSALLLAQGGLAVQKLDAVPALLLAWAFWAACERKHATAGVALGLAAASKLVPVLLVAPLIAADRETWTTWRARLRGAVGFAAALGLGLAPMLVPPKGMLDVLKYHGQRGLQVESTWGVLLGTWRLVTGTASPTRQTFGSFNFDDGFATVLARLSTPATLVAIGVITLWLWRAPAPAGETARRDRIALAMLASLAALWLTSKVFSPQYMTWAMPLVLAPSWPVARRATWALGAAMAVTQLYLRGYYDYVTDLRPLGVVTVLVRLALLVAFVAIVARGLRGDRPRVAEAPA